MHSSLPLTPCLQADYGVLWERINWLNPTIPFNATTIPKGTTVCVKNGAPPPDVPLLPEPGGRALGLKQLALATGLLCECEQGPTVCERCVLRPLLLTTLCQTPSTSYPPLQPCPAGCRPGLTSLCATPACTPIEQPTSPAAVRQF